MSKRGDYTGHRSNDHLAPEALAIQARSGTRGRSQIASLTPDQQIQEYICNENNNDVQRIVGS